MNQTITKHSPRKIDKSLLVVDPEHPLETLPFISDSLVFMGAFFGIDSSPPMNPRAEAGAGIILDFLSASIDDVHDAIVGKYLKDSE